MREAAPDKSTCLRLRTVLVIFGKKYSHSYNHRVPACSGAITRAISVCQRGSKIVRLGYHLKRLKKHFFKGTGPLWGGKVKISDLYFNLVLFANELYRCMRPDARSGREHDTQPSLPCSRVLPKEVFRESQRGFSAPVDAVWNGYPKNWEPWFLTLWKFKMNSGVYGFGMKIYCMSMTSASIACIFGTVKLV